MIVYIQLILLYFLFNRRRTTFMLFILRDNPGLSEFCVEIYKVKCTICDYVYPPGYPQLNLQINTEINDR